MQIERKLRGRTKPAKPKTKIYSLWLMPEGEVYRQLRGVIRKLSEEYSAPIFKPHVTLLGRIVASRRDVLPRSAQIAQRMRPLSIWLGALDGFDEYYRCLFARVRKTGTLTKAYLAALKIFRLEDRPDFMPHLSLVYGNLPTRAKAGIIRKLGRQLSVKFKACKLHLYLTTGSPRAWRQVRVYNLPRPS